METFEEYLATIDTQEHRDRMEHIFEWIKQTFPQLEQRIAWNQPMFTDHGTFIVGFSVAKKHMSVSPERAGMIHFEETLQEGGYDHTKQLVRFKWSEPFDFSLLEKMITFNIEDKADCSTFWRKE